MKATLRLRLNNIKSLTSSIFAPLQSPLRFNHCSASISPPLLFTPTIISLDLLFTLLHLLSASLLISDLMVETVLDVKRAHVGLVVHDSPKAVIDYLLMEEDTER